MVISDQGRDLVTIPLSAIHAGTRWNAAGLSGFVDSASFGTETMPSAARDATILVIARFAGRVYAAVFPPLLGCGLLGFLVAACAQRDGFSTRPPSLFC